MTDAGSLRKAFFKANCDLVLLCVCVCVHIYRHVCVCIYIYMFGLPLRNGNDSSLKQMNLVLLQNYDRKYLKHSIY